MKQLKTITLGELKEQLAWVLALPDKTEITFGQGDLSFFTAKTALYDNSEEPVRVQIRFNELYQITHDPAANS